MPVKDRNKNIEIKGVRVHNLKNISLSIPRDLLIVITGLSGSGKPTLEDQQYRLGLNTFILDGDNARKDLN